MAGPEMPITSMPGPVTVAVCRLQPPFGRQHRAVVRDPVNERGSGPGGTGRGAVQDDSMLTGPGPPIRPLCAPSQPDLKVVRCACA